VGRQLKSKLHPYYLGLAKETASVSDFRHCEVQIEQDRSQRQPVQLVCTERSQRAQVFFLADIWHEVNSKPAHGKPEYAAPKFVLALHVCATRQRKTICSTPPEWIVQSILKVPGVDGGIGTDNSGQRVAVVVVPWLNSNSEVGTRYRLLEI
jgi:hypothetical protein